MKNSGFTLVELLIAITLSSILLTALYQIFRQTQKSVSTAQTAVDITRTITAWYELMLRDCAAVFIPRVVGEKQIDKLFSLTQDGKLLKQFTFLTTHHLPVFGERTPDYVRVWYRLEEMEKASGLYVLKRQESASVKDFESGKVRAYDIISRIKECEITCFVQKPEEKEKKEAQPSYERLTSWSAEERIAKNLRALPEFLLINLTILDEQNREQKQQLRVAIKAQPYDQRKAPTPQAPKDQMPPQGLSLKLTGTPQLTLPTPPGRP